MKKIHIFLAMLIFALAPVSTFAHNFIDIDDNWAKSYIDWAAEKNLIQGFPDKTFKPQDRVSRAQVYEIFKNLWEKKDFESPIFKDVSYKSWFWNALALAQAKNYLIYDSENFMPSAKTTRIECAMIISKIYRISSDSIDNFKDTSNLSKEERNALESLRSLGIINGFLDGSFKPQDPLTRAQVCKILNLCVDKLGYPKDDQTLDDIRSSLKKVLDKAQAIKNDSYTNRSYENLIYETDRALEILARSTDKLEIQNARKNLENALLGLVKSKENKNKLVIEIRNEIGEVLDADVTLDKKDFKSGQNISPGRHLIEVNAKGYKPESSFFDFEDASRHLIFILKREDSSLVRLILAPTLSSNSEGLVEPGSRVEILASPPFGKSLKHFLVNGKIKKSNEDKLIFIIKEDSTVDVVYE